MNEITFTRYANVTDKQKEKVIAAFKGWVSMKGIDIGQAVSIAANDGFGLTSRQWNSKIGEDAFAAALGILLMAGVIKISTQE